MVVLGPPILNYKPSPTMLTAIYDNQKKINK